MIIGTLFDDKSIFEPWIAATRFALQCNNPPEWKNVGSRTGHNKIKKHSARRTVEYVKKVHSAKPYRSGPKNKHNWKLRERTTRHSLHSGRSWLWRDRQECHKKIGNTKSLSDAVQSKPHQPTRTFQAWDDTVQVIGQKWTRKGCTLHLPRKIMRRYVKPQRIRIKKSTGNTHRGGYVSMSHYNMVHKPMHISRAMTTIEAKAAVDKKWKTSCRNFQLGTRQKRKSKAEVIRRAKLEDKEVHFCHSNGLVSSQELRIGEKKFQKYQGRVAWRGGSVKLDTGNCAPFTKQSASASHMMAAKVLDVISRLPECSGQASDAASADAQVKMKGSPERLYLSEEDCPKVWISLPRARRSQKLRFDWRSSCTTGAQSLWSLIGWTPVGDKNLRTFWQEKDGKSPPDWNAFPFIAKCSFSCQCVFTT